MEQNPTNLLYISNGKPNDIPQWTFNPYFEPYTSDTGVFSIVH